MNINISLHIKGFNGMKPLIKERRGKKGLLQKYCAEKAGISQQLWSAYEKGTKFPRVDRAFIIAKVLECKVDDLYEVVNEEKRDYNL
jgi:putative transcriptional regulator